MSASVTIAVDAMGGDHAPGVVLKGVDIALVRYPGARFLLFGDQSRVAPLLAKLPRVAKATTLQHTDEVVADDAKPSVALRAARRSSMRLAIEAVAEGRADGVAHVWDDAGRAVATLKWDNHPVLKAMFSVDGRWVLTVHAQLCQVSSGVRLWPTDLLSAARRRQVRDFTPEERERFEIDN